MSDLLDKMGSFDPDHALAILLQARFNEEAKKDKKNNKENLPIAIKRPSPKSSLIDPEWEITDPCPDVHALFLAFNDRFFWGRLLGVEVKWSHQMTSCAGVCVYEGRNGLCSVRLSAPLLKLRPRSDLIETLLHEMIHAYLFVTNNNKDRDGHGPEFHKHMNRINKDAGTNITVYHSFHAEVKVYQQHWWRCNGPCQHRSPFFGMVKRAKNRAPGPNDLWWADHQAVCGGQFIKVREPENYKNKKKGSNSKAVTAKPEKDIRNFFKKPVSGPATVTSAKPGNNIFSFNDFSKTSTLTTDVKPPPPAGGNYVNRVTGFNDLSASISKPTGPLGKGHVLGRGSASIPRGRGMPSGRGMGRGGMLANKGGGTLVVSGPQVKNKPADDSKSPNTKLRVDTFSAFSGQGFSLGGSSNASNHSRSRLLDIGYEPKEKKRKSDDQSDIIDLDEPPMDDEMKEICKCSVCNKSMPLGEMYDHLETCAVLMNVFNNTSSVDETEMDSINQKNKITSCPVCALNIEGDINNHLDECLNTSGVLNIFNDPVIELSDSESPVKMDWGSNAFKPKVDSDCDLEIIESENRVACPICGMRFGESKINDHVNQCIDSD